MRHHIVGFVTAVALVAGVFALPPLPVAAKASMGTAGEEPTIVGKWNNAAVNGSAQSNYTLEYGFPEEHATAMRVPSTNRSVIIDPPDGKIPFQPWAMKLRDARDRIHTDWSHMKSKDLDPQSKCYPGGVPRVMNRDAPLITRFPDRVLMQFEWDHQYRVIYTDGRPHLPKRIKLWYGDSRGHWEGNTLVVETTNLNGYAWLDVIGSFFSDDATVVERFTPIDANTLKWSATITDPNVFTRPWTMGWNYVRNRGQATGNVGSGFFGPADTPGSAEIWEHACIEGNNHFPVWQEIRERELIPKAK